MIQSEIISGIIHPSDEMRPVPWWSWTGRMEFGEMRRQLREMSEQGIREYFIFPCYGLEFPVFLEESWWDYVDFALRESERLGMKVWIYDDLSWPSGSAGGKVLQTHPEYRMQLLQCRKTRLDAGDMFSHEPSNELVYAEFRTDTGEIAPVELDGDFRWKNTTGKCGYFITFYKVLYDGISLNSTGVAWNRWQRGALDLLNPNAVKAWMHFIHDEYYARFKESFGKTIKGFFCDEPRPNRPDGHSIPWTDRLPKMFSDMHGYDVRPLLPKLFFNGAGCFNVRIDFWKTVADCFCGSFMRPLSEWCHERNVEFTGHAVPEELIYQRNMLVSNGDIQRILCNMSIPGCDLLGCQTPFFNDPASCWYGKGERATRNLILTLKRPASVARYSGAKKALCEAFGVRSWHGDMREQKRINDCLAAMGINFINDNSLSYTIGDFRHLVACKHFTQPWWRHYNLFMECSARLSAFASSGQLDTEIAILFPQTTQMCMTPGDIDEPIPPEGNLEEPFNRTSEILLKNHIDFEYIFEYVLEDAEIDSGRIKIPNGEISLLILPQAVVISETVWAKLCDFMESGGKVIAIGCAPKWIAGQGGKLRKFPKNRKLQVFYEADDRLVESCRGIASKWTLEGGDAEKVVASMRKCDGCNLLLVANQLPGSRKLRLVHALKGDTIALSPDGGGMFAPCAKKVCGKTTIDFELSEDESLIFVIGENLKPQHLELLGVTKGKRLALKEKWDFSINGGNHYIPECWIRLDPFDKGEKEKWFLSELGNLDAPLWRPVMHGRTAIGLSPEESEFYWLAGTFVLENVPEDLALIVDDDLCESVYCNGLKVGKSSKACLWDQNNRLFKLSAASVRGINRLFLKVRTSQWFSQKRGLTGYYEFRSVDRYPLLFVLQGTFGVFGDKLKAIPKQLKCGAWSRQGFPFFVGTGEYRQSFKIDSIPDKAILHISDARSTVEVLVNGKSVGVRAWKPFRYDITDALEKGDNEIAIKIDSSLGNILQRSYSERWSPPEEYGLIGRAFIEVF